MLWCYVCLIIFVLVVVDGCLCVWFAECFGSLGYCCALLFFCLGLYVLLHCLADVYLICGMLFVGFLICWLWFVGVFA